MLRKFLTVLLIFVPIMVCAQRELKIKKNHGGLFSLGVRNTISTFNDGNWKDVGTGVGGQFRIQLTDRINTEWYADYLTSAIGNVGSRKDVHVGWSVMYYLLKDKTYKRLLKPYVVAGHCFDFTQASESKNRNNSFERWSAAIQAGLGNHFNITEHFDITIVAQYMFHLGKHISAIDNQGAFEIETQDGFNLEGHLLFTVGVNYKIADMW